MVEVITRELIINSQNFLLFLIFRFDRFDLEVCENQKEREDIIEGINNFSVMLMDERFKPDS